LIENVRHHVKEEENEFFPQVRAQLNRTSLADLGQALADAKKTAPTRPHPRMPDEPPANAVVGALAGVVDRVGGNVSGIAQGSVSVVQDLIARIIGSSTPKSSVRGSSDTRRRAKQMRSSASSAAGRVKATGQQARGAAAKTAKTAASGAKATATTAKKSTRATKTTAKRAATTTGRTAKSQAKKTVATARRPTSTRRARTRSAA
jgi:hypothetical protein